MRIPYKLAGLGLCFAGTSFAGTALAQQSQSPDQSWLSWSGPQECRNTAEVERQVQSLLGRNVDFTTLPGTHVLVAWTKRQKWEFKVQVKLEEGQRERRVYSESCSEGFDVVALTLALLLDAQEPTNGGQGDPLPPQAADQEQDIDWNATEASVPVPSPDSETAATGSATATRSSTDASSPGTPMPTKPFTLGGTLRNDVGTFPLPLYGGGIQVGFRRNGSRFELGAEYLVSGSDGLPNSLSPVQYSLASATAEACKHFSIAEQFDYTNCLGLQVGSLAIREEGGLNRQALALWSGAQLGAGLGYLASPKWYNFIRLQLVFPLLRHELLLEGGGVVHTLPSVSVQIQAGMAFDMTD